MNVLLKTLCLLFAVGGALTCRAQLTLDYCLCKAEENYPVLKKYGIADKLTETELSDIGKTLLPQATVYAQGSVQNAVPEFPEALSGMMQQLGQEFKGLGKAQYRAGIDLTQTIWDGGLSASRRDVARSDAEQRKAALDVEMYALRARVENAFFGWLLVDEQMQIAQSNIELLKANLEQMKAMKRHGAAMQSDVDMIDAQLLSASQQLASMKGMAGQFRMVLEVMTGESIGRQTPVRPADATVTDLTPASPELALFNAREKAASTRKSLVRAGLMPKIGLFASAYYGYPGYNYFKSMRTRDMSFNITGGVKVSWNLGAFYTRRNDLTRIEAANEETAADRAVFLYNNRISTNKNLAEIEAMREIMADDARIIELRANVRRAAESQLRNGVIDATTLLAKITDENNARLTAAYHEIKLLQLNYQLKNTLNR